DLLGRIERQERDFMAVLTGRERQGRHSAIARVITLARPPRLIFPGVLYYDLPLAPGNQVGEVEGVPQSPSPTIIRRGGCPGGSPLRHGTSAPSRQSKLGPP